MTPLDSRSSFTDLPDELLENILIKNTHEYYQFYNLAAVCQKFSNIILTEYNIISFLSPEYSPLQVLTTSTYLEKIFKYCYKNGIQIDLTERDTEINPEYISNLPQLCSFSDFKFNEHDYINDIPHYKPRENPFIKSIAINSPSLRKLDLINCRLITDEAMNDVATNCTGLESLKLTHIPNIGDKGCQSIAKNCVNLKTFEIIAKSGNPALNFSDDSVLTLTKNCTSLKQLNLSAWNHNVTSQSVQHIIKFASETIQKFKLNTLGEVTKEDLIHFINSCPNINKFSINVSRLQIDDFIFATIAKKWTKLSELELFDASQITGVGMRGITFNSLQSLTLFDFVINKIGLTQILSRTPLLQTIKFFSGKIEINQGDLAEIFIKNAPNLQNLKEVLFHKTNLQFDKNSLETLKSKFPKLSLMYYPEI